MNKDLTLLLQITMMLIHDFNIQNSDGFQANIMDLEVLLNRMDESIVAKAKANIADLVNDDFSFLGDSTESPEEGIVHE